MKKLLIIIILLTLSNFLYAYGAFKVIKMSLTNVETQRTYLTEIPTAVNMSITINKSNNTCKLALNTGAYWKMSNIKRTPFDGNEGYSSLASDNVGTVCYVTIVYPGPKRLDVYILYSDVLVKYELYGG